MTDPFETLGVDARFDLDPRALEQRHRDLSRALHPDRYTGAPAAERRMALSRAVDVNEAFRVLRDPIRRAEALLRKAGVLAAEGSEPKASPVLLMEMMEVREELAEARRAKDLARVGKLGEAMRAREQAVLSAMGRAFEAAGGEREKIAAILPALGELRYLRRFLDEVSAIEEDLAP